MIILNNKILLRLLFILLSMIVGVGSLERSNAVSTSQIPRQPSQQLAHPQAFFSKNAASNSSDSEKVWSVDLVTAKVALFATLTPMTAMRVVATNVSRDLNFVYFAQVSEQLDMDNLADISGSVVQQRVADPQNAK